MQPVLEGRIARRILVNFRLDPEWARLILPAPFEPEIRNGYAVAGVCLIRLEEMRPKGLPAWTGLHLESAAHRIAIRQPDTQEGGHGVYIFRRETDSRLTEMTGGVFSRADSAGPRLRPRRMTIGFVWRCGRSMEASMSRSTRRLSIPGRRQRCSEVSMKRCNSLKRAIAGMRRRFGPVVLKAFGSLPHLGGPNRFRWSRRG